ncbi:response regulator transcription factor [Pseudorhodoferax sp.]|uniref:response regulator transcription factor n=1 Tax=Pseudorhodoferax sp. TaxID=1993553 RepID=UPI002DD63661|nr:response regulator [Pseudorhodoferax sp.]
MSEAAGAFILVAEDDPDIRANLQRLLRLEGYRVSAVADGRAALAAVLAQSPDLLLTDAMMPELDGESLVRLLRADARHARLPVLLLTARADSEDRARALAAGASAVVTKPFHRAVLLDSIRGLLAGGAVA